MRQDRNLADIEVALEALQQGLQRVARIARALVVVAIGEEFSPRGLGEQHRQVPDHYDDGGFSGGSLERPALKRLLADIDRAKIVITNYHAFKLRERMEVAKGARTAIEGWRGEKLQTLETEGQMLQRVMPELMGMKNIVVLNDEAHHCYRERVKDAAGETENDLKGEEKEEAKENNEAARMWISGLEAVKRKLGLALVYDLSATPFFLRGSGYIEGTLFPWTMSDFSLMDAIECGIVKLPRVPVADNVPGGDTPKFRNLWDHIGNKLPKKGRGASGKSLDPLSLPAELLTALEALYGHYAKTFELWENAGVGVPPVFIVVCNNTSTSELIYKYVSGFHRENDDGSTTLENGRQALFRNYDDFGNRIARPNTILIDSAQLESGEALDKDFREMAADEIERFRREMIERTGDIHAGDNIDDLHMSNDLKTTGAGNLFVIFGEPDIKIEDAGADASGNPLIRVKVFGVDVFKPQTGEVISEGTSGIALWMLDTDYNEESFFVRHAYFLGANDLYKALKTTLKAEIDAEAGAVCIPIRRGRSRSRSRGGLR
jgi:hypothetical protein